MAYDASTKLILSIMTLRNTDIAEPEFMHSAIRRTAQAHP